MEKSLIIPKSKEVATAAIRMAITADREEEKLLQKQYRGQEMRTAAVDFGGEALSALAKMIERSVIAAKREGVIHESHAEEGAVAGATHEVMSQVMSRFAGLNVGGKIGIARQGEHICVAVFFGIGMIHLDDVAIGVAHRAVAISD